MHTVVMKFRSLLSTRSKLPNRYPSISVVIPPPDTLNITRPKASMPVRNIAMDASPVNISLDCNSYIIMDAIMLKTRA